MSNLKYRLLAILALVLASVWALFPRTVVERSRRGTAFVYDTAPVGTDCGLAGPGAFCVADGAAYWMSHNGFHMFAGGAVVSVPNSEDIASYVFDNLSEANHEK